MNKIVPFRKQATQALIDEEAATWFICMRGKSLPAEKQAAFESWCARSPQHRQAFDQMQALWRDDAFNEILATRDLSPQTWQQVERFLTSSSHPKQYRASAHWRWFRALAACLVIAGVGFILDQQNCWRQDFCTAVGEIRQIQLSDGSSVTLNSDTRMNVNGQRQVSLERGEALFEVQRDPQHPFIVSSRFSQTKVLGTRFVVKQEAQGDYVSVINGLVEVSRSGQKTLVLRANEQASALSHQLIKFSSSATERVADWSKGRLLFENAPLKTVLSELARYRRGTILLNNTALENLKVSGRFEIQNTDLALESLKQTLPIKLKRISPWLVIVS